MSKYDLLIQYCFGIECYYAASIGAQSATSYLVIARILDFPAPQWIDALAFGSDIFGWWP